jgi:hypothetical protein
MKKLSLMVMIACASNLSAVSASARDSEDNDRPAYSFLLWGDRLDSEINHLNRMRGHVRWELGYYRARASSRLRREFAELSREIDHINWRFKQRDYDRRRLRREVERAHAELHRIEVELHVRARDYYLWR